jgi:PleD family two-component response regulator
VGRAATTIEIGDIRINVTVSIGAALGEALPGSDQPLLAELIARADEALYRTKAGGRNRVSMALDWGKGTSSEAHHDRWNYSASEEAPPS